MFLSHPQLSSTPSTGICTGHAMETRLPTWTRGKELLSKTRFLCWVISGMWLFQVRWVAGLESHSPNPLKWLLCWREPALFNDILNRHTIPSTAKGQAAWAFGDEILAQCCHPYTLVVPTHAASHLRVVLPFLSWKINAVSLERFCVSPLESNAYSSLVTGYCYQAALTLFITSFPPAATIHLILVWLFLCFDLRTVCSKAALKEMPKEWSQGSCQVIYWTEQSPRRCLRK